MMFVISLSESASAAVNSSDYLDWYLSGLTAESGGSITISVKIDACGDMTKVGASKIYLYESADGKSFTRIETYKYEDYPEMMGSGWYYIADPITFTGTPGYAYYAIVYCYAGDSTGHDEKPYTTPIVYARGPVSTST